MIGRNIIFTLCNDFFDLKTLNDKQYVTFTNLLKRAMHIFKFKNTPDGIDERLLKFIIAIRNDYVIADIDGQLRVVYGGLSGDLDFYGIPTQYLWNTGTNGGTLNLSDCVYATTNTAMIPNVLNLIYYTNMLSEIDKSLDIAIKNTRLCPIIKANSDSERIRYQKMMEKVIDGNYYSEVFEKSLEDIANTGKVDKVVDLFNHTGDSNYIPMILQAYDNVFARYNRECGINVTNVMKRAQVINAEVNGYENYTQSYVDDMLECVLKMVQETNDKYGTNWEVELCEYYKDDNATSGISEPDAEK